jgi:hypothetical protein
MNDLDTGVSLPAVENQPPPSAAAVLRATMVLEMPKAGPEMPPPLPPLELPAITLLSIVTTAAGLSRGTETAALNPPPSCVARFSVRVVFRMVETDLLRSRIPPP